MSGRGRGGAGNRTKAATDSGVGKRKNTATASGASKRKNAVTASGSGAKPERPPSAFFVFLTEFRQEYNAQHPDNTVELTVTKAAAERWRDMSQQEKEPYVVQANQRKQAYWDENDEESDDE